MATWGLVLETTVGMGERKHTEAYVLAHVEGSRESALAALEARARGYRPEHPRSPRRSRLFRHGDGFLLVVDGAWQSHVTRFTVAELVEDSERPPPGPARDAGGVEPSGAEAPAPPPPTVVPSAADAVPCDEDGVPLRPSWLGRHDLPGSMP